MDIMRMKNITIIIQSQGDLDKSPLVSKLGNCLFLKSDPGLILVFLISQTNECKNVLN